LNFSDARNLSFFFGSGSGTFGKTNFKDMHSTNEIAKAVDYVINDDDVYQIPFPVFLEENRDTIEEAMFKQFRPSQRKPVHLVARRIHANSLDKAIDAGKNIPIEALTYHQYTTGLFNRIQRLVQKNKISI
jgi:hypothetical protein